MTFVVPALRRIVAAVVLLVGAATVLGLLDRFFWIFVLTDIFRVQYAVLLVGAAAVALLLRRPRLAGVAAALAAVNIAVIGFPVTALATAADPQERHSSLRLLIANVEAGNTHFDDLTQLVERTRPDVLGVVELTPALAANLENALPDYDARKIATQTGAYGIGVYSRLPLLSASVERYPTGGPPTIIALVRVDGKPVTLVVTHVHTPFAGSIHTRHLSALAHARPQLGARLAMCGDFNTPPWSGPFRKLTSDAHLANLYGSGSWSAYSWPTWSSLLRIPLDNCLISPGLGVVRHEHGPSIGSDHFPLIVDLALME